MRTEPLLAHYKTAPPLYFTRDKQSEHEQSSPNVKLKVLLNFLARLQAKLGSALDNVLKETKVSIVYAKSYNQQTA